MTSSVENGSLSIPHKRISKTIKKYIGIESYQLIQIKGILTLYSQIKVFKIQAQSVTCGYVYINRVNSCRGGGCSITTDNEVEEFEYFDYYFVTDEKGIVQKVKIYNYQATQGHQVMSAGWLKQFIGFRGDQNLVYGKDIQAISGATVSATSLIHDIEDAEEIINRLLE